MRIRRKENVLFFDIETTPLMVFSWGLGKQHINYKQIYKEKKVICICYKWAGDKKVHHLVMNLAKHRLHARDDKADFILLKRFSRLIKKADLVVAHNGRRFDVARLKERLVKFNLPPLSPFLVDDTYMDAKNIGFTSHKLDYLCEYLGLGRKLDTGFSLWIGVMHKDKKCLNKMVRYGDHDVVLLERLFNRIRPHTRHKLNAAVFHGDPNLCTVPNCGGKLCSNGVRFNGLGKYRRLECNRCGHHVKGGINQIHRPNQYPRSG